MRRGATVSRRLRADGVALSRRHRGPDGRAGFYESWQTNARAWSIICKVELNDD